MHHTIIEHIDRVAEDVVSLVLRSADGPLPPWEPGAHIDLHLPNWLSRQYSLCGDPADRGHYRIAVRHDPLSRGGSEYIHRFLRQGRSLTVSSPRNHFPLVPAPEYLFLAGGIGITPILPMLQAAVAAGAAATLVYGGRSMATMPFTTELSSRYGDRVHLFPAQVKGMPDLAALAAKASPHTLVYCCGPAPMVDAAKESFPAELLHSERFQPSARTFAPNAAFKVACARSGRTVEVSPDESMLDALSAAGYTVPSACREGVCGSCELVVIDGEPEHRDDIGASEGRMYPCVSRALSSQLVVDL